jgi:hypothetical protein
MVQMRMAVMALSALGTAYAAFEMPALRWTDDPLGNDALLTFFSDATYGVRGTWESVTADGRSICIGPPITANSFALPEVRLTRDSGLVWPGVAETVTTDGYAICVAPEDAPVDAVIGLGYSSTFPTDDASSAAYSSLDLPPLTEGRYTPALVEREIFSTRRLTRLSAMAPTCRRIIC